MKRVSGSTHSFDWEFPSTEVPEYLRPLNPALYEEQSRRVAQRFEQAVELAEQAFMEELDRLVNHLAERLAGSEDGKPILLQCNLYSPGGRSAGAPI